MQPTQKKLQAEEETKTEVEILAGKILEQFKPVGVDDLRKRWEEILANDKRN